MESPEVGAILVPRTDVQQVSNWSDLPPIRTKTSPVDRSLSMTETELYMKGQLPAPERPAVESYADPTYQAPAPQAPASPQPAPIATTSIPAPGPTPAPAAAPGVRDRIMKLFGTSPASEQTGDPALIGRVAQLEAELSRLRTMPAPGPAPARPAYGQDPYSTNEPTAPVGAPSQDYLSRSEFQQWVAQTRQEADNARHLQSSHAVSRFEAERDFPDVFRQPELYSAAQELWVRDRSLQTDPQGPYKAAALVTALAGQSGNAQPGALGAASPDVRKAQLAGFGVTVPAGNPANNNQQNDRAARYRAALAKARATGRAEDAAIAYHIAKYES